MKYLKKINSKILNYYHILEPHFPKWLEEYIETKELLSQQYISVTCGTIYSDLFESKFFFSSLDHSIGVALIVWHFTHNKKQTLAGLFHDIATPCFKHCIDFLNGDHKNQESTEDKTTEIILNSKQIMNLLKRDGIDINEVNDYHIYPIADNDTPMLSADRLEYSLSNALFTYELLKEDDIRTIYEDICIQKNEQGIDELGFQTKKIAREFVRTTSKLSIIYREDRTRYSMQLIADILKRLVVEKKIVVEDLYHIREEDVIKIIEDSSYRDVFNKWREAKKVKSSIEEPKGVYFVHVPSKVRYINPLWNEKRIYDQCKIAKKMIDKNLEYKMDNYVYLDLNF